MKAPETLSGLQNATKFFDMLRRRKMLFISATLIVSSAIIAGGTFLPKIYRATTTILVEPPKIPTDYVKPLINVPVEQRLKTITQQVTSRSRLLKIIRGLNLAKENISAFELEAMVTGMQEQIEVEVK